MGKLSVYPNSVQSPSFVPLSIRREIESRAQCPWCDSPMYLNRSSDGLQCVDSIHCAGIVLVEEVMQCRRSPSQDDTDLTRRIVEAGTLMGIDVLDHLMVGDGDFLSMKERGLM